MTFQLYSHSLYDSYTGSVSEDALEFSFTTSEGRVFVHKLTHYIGEGLFIVRYRLHREAKSLTITITYDGEHVADSPYNLGKSELHDEKGHLFIMHSLVKINN